jgi:hypothetical protein
VLVGEPVQRFVPPTTHSAAWNVRRVQIYHPAHIMRAGLPAAPKAKEMLADQIDLIEDLLLSIEAGAVGDSDDAVRAGYFTWQGEPHANFMIDRKTAALIGSIPRKVTVRGAPK